jgi:uncharacterized protein YjcR
MSEAKIKKAITLYQSGLSFVTISEKLGVNPETIRQAFIKQGVKVRGAHELRHHHNHRSSP